MRKVLIYTVHKAASGFLHTLTIDIARKLGIDYYSINNEDHYDIIQNNSWNYLIEDDTKTGCFGPIRSGEAMPSIPSNLEQFSIILHLRDPRDMLTSLFFSHTYSHPKKMGFDPGEDQQNKWAEEGIDNFVINNMENFKNNYQLMCSKLLGRDNVIFLKYEDLVEDFDEWLKQYLKAFSHIKLPKLRFYKFIPFPNSFRRFRKKLPLVEYKNMLKALPEDKYRHKRQVTPGDHKRKLKPETIEILNEKFSSIMSLLNYTF